jgi:micrococcal nuclease
LKRRSNKPKFTLVSLLVLLAFFFYYKGCTPDVEERTEQPAQPLPRAKKTKEKKPLRHLTVFEGKVTGIKDGDTFEVLYDGQPEKVRLAEIDCPEKSQAFGKNARQYASDLCFGKTVTVVSTGKRDRYGRVVGTITTGDGTDVNEELVKAGFAWHYKQYSKNEQLSDLEEEARVKRLGLWADKNPIAPWEWRRAKRNKSNR